MWQRLLLWMVVLVWGQAAHSQTVFREVFGNSACYDEGYSIVPLGSGYLLSTAYLCNAGWQSRMLLLDSNGDSIDVYNATPYNGYIEPTNDGNYLYLGGNRAGLAYDTIVIAKVNQQFDTIWTTQLFFPECNNQVYSATEVSDGHIVTGIFSETVCNNGPSFQSFAVKLDLDGNVVWQQTYGGAADDDELFVVKEQANGQLWFYGWKRDSNAIQPWLLVTNANGDSLTSYFSATLGAGSGYGFDLTSVGGFITISYSDSIYARKFDSNVGLEWERSLGIPSGGIYFRAFEMQDRNFGFLACLDGPTGCDSHLFKLNTDGDITWDKSWNGLLRNVSEPEPGQFILTGYTNAFPVLPEVLVVRFDTIFDSLPNFIIETDWDIGLSIYPNPAIGIMQIACSETISKIGVYSLNGSKLLHETISPEFSYSLNIEKLPMGLYLLKVETNSGRWLFRKFQVAD
jgi:hypothetical protein